MKDKCKNPHPSLRHELNIGIQHCQETRPSVVLCWWAQTNRNQSYKAVKMQRRDSVQMCDVAAARQWDLWAFHPQNVLEPTLCSFCKVTRFDKGSWNHTCVWVLCNGWDGCPGGRDSNLTVPACGQLRSLLSNTTGIQHVSCVLMAGQVHQKRTGYEMLLL